MNYIKALQKSRTICVFETFFFLFVLLLLIDHCWTEVQVSVLQRIVTLWRSCERDTLVNHMCWRVWVSNSTTKSRWSGRFFYFFFAAHYCLCVMMGVNTETYRQVWRLQGDHPLFKKNDNRSAFLSVIRLLLAFLIVYQVLEIPF